jgi:hypothetical protein
VQGHPVKKKKKTKTRNLTSKLKKKKKETKAKIRPLYPAVEGKKKNEHANKTTKDFKSKVKEHTI